MAGQITPPDGLPFDRLQEIITIETASRAADILVRWGGLALGALVLALAILGFSTYADLKSRINGMSTAISADLDGRKSEILNELDGKVADIDKALKEKEARVAKLDASIDDITQRLLQREKQFYENVNRIEISVISNSQFQSALRISIYDAKETSSIDVTTPADPQNPKTRKVRENLSTIYKFFDEVYGFKSIDGNNAEIKVVINYEKGYNNAFWDGRTFVIGNGDGILFSRFDNLDMLATQFGHAVTQSLGGLKYSGQSGALNSHISDVFASLVEQWHSHTSADQADWLIGESAFGPDVTAAALRSLKAPGTAYDDVTLGKDPQVSRLADYRETTEDSGGIHINSGIPNHAFYLAATKIGGFGWEAPGKIWLRTLRRLNNPNADFKTFAALTLTTSTELYGENSPEAKAVRDAWAEVGIAL